MIISILNNTYRTLTDFNVISIIFRICMAMIVGAIIGSERGRHGRAAGIRTHTLVCLGSALTVIVGLYAVFRLGLPGDPLRISAQVISGIGFLGAGTILTRNHSQVTGLTTAAGLWTTAAIGLAIGIGLYSGALAGFAALEITIILFSKIEKEKRKDQTDSFYVELESVKNVNDFYDQLDDFDSSIGTIQIVKAKSGTPAHIGVEFVVSSTEISKDMICRFRALDYVVVAARQSI